jgi:hypothetical protein
VARPERGGEAEEAALGSLARGPVPHASATGSTPAEPRPPKKGERERERRVRGRGAF